MIERIFSMKFVVFILLLVSLTACGDREVNVSSMGLQLKAPKISSKDPYQNPLDDSFTIVGECHPSTHGFEIRIGSQHRYISKDWTNNNQTFQGSDLDCTDSNFSILLSNDNLQLIGLNIDQLKRASKLQISLSTPFGPSKPVTYTNPTYVSVFSRVQLDPTLFSYISDIETGMNSGNYFHRSIANQECIALKYSGYDAEEKPMPFKLSQVQFSLTDSNYYQLPYNGLYLDSNCITSLPNPPTNSPDLSANSHTVYFKSNTVVHNRVRLTTNVSGSGSYGGYYSFDTFFKISDVEPATITPYNGSLKPYQIVGTDYYYKFELHLPTAAQGLGPFSLYTSPQTEHSTSNFMISLNNPADNFSTYLGNLTLAPGKTHFYIVSKVLLNPASKFNITLQSNYLGNLINQDVLLEPPTP